MMRKLRLICLYSVLCSLRSFAVIPDSVIPFVYDGHLYIQAVLNDSIPATLVYDTGSDFLYLDADYLRLNHRQNTFGRKGKGKIGGAGNADPISVDVLMDSVGIRCGVLEYQNKITPILRLREILGRHIDGLLGNMHLLKTPLAIHFSGCYMRPLHLPLSKALFDGYTKLTARFDHQRIDVMATLDIDMYNRLEGWFRMDLGSGSALTLTNEAASSLNLTTLSKAYYRTQVIGIGGNSEGVVLRASKFCLVDTLENLVIDYTLNEKGALSYGRPYLGLIGNEIWSLYDIILDPSNEAVWVKRNTNVSTYEQASVTHMITIDRTDICDGWVVNGLYQGGIAEQAGIEIGDIIIAINHRPVKTISLEEQRRGLSLSGTVVYTIQKLNGKIVSYSLLVDKQII